MKKIIQICRKHILLLLLGTFIGLSALLLVHLLPTAPLKENVRWSMPAIEQEFTDEVLIDGYKSTLTGNFTDCLMLEHAIYDSPHNILEQTLLMYRAESCNDPNDPEAWWPGHSLKDYVENVPPAREVEYSRYWHGYLVILKPLLALTTFNNIRLINSVLQLILAGLVIIGFCQKKAPELAKTFLISLPFLFFVSTYSSLSLSICFYIMLIALLLQNKWDEKIYNKNMYGEFFLIIGMATSYFDFLTYPLITLGYPLCVYLYFHGSGFRKDIKRILWYSAEWFIGYIGLWSTKWLLTDLFTGSSTIQNALSTVLLRTQSAENSSRTSGFLHILAKNSDPYTSLGYIILVFLVFLLFLWRVLKSEKAKLLQNIPAACTFVLIACYPLIWYLVTQNHSEQHWQFTCRILAVTVFAGTTALNRVLKKESE